MTNKTKILIGVGAVSLIGLYFFLKPKNKIGQKGCPDGSMKDASSGACVPIVIPPNPNPPAPNDNSAYDNGYTDTPDTPTEQTCLSYKVSTSSSNLNVRSQPNTSSDILRAIPKGQIVLARPSVSGWMELCSTETTIYTPQQFVSSTYLSKA
jgi:uncharacterized protein YgiM (DUF1202 family)